MQDKKREQEQQRREQQRQEAERKRKEAEQQAEELQLEQTPILKQKPFNVLKAREQAKSGPSHRKHVHSELSKKKAQKNPHI